MQPKLATSDFVDCERQNIIEKLRYNQIEASSRLNGICGRYFIGSGFNESIPAITTNDSTAMDRNKSQ